MAGRGRMNPLLQKIGISLPIIQAPMAGVSTSEMAAAVSNAGGLGSIGGSVVTGFALGLLQTLGAVIFPAFNDTLIFMLMIVVLMIRPSGLFGTPESAK